MFRGMPPVRNLSPGHKISYPNRDKAASKATKSIVALLLLVSAALMLIVTIGGWTKLEGMQPLNFLLIVVYLLFALYTARWKRGVLPMVAATAIIVLILAAVAGTGASGTSWFDRSNSAFAPAGSLFGGSGLSQDALGLVTLLLIPVQALLIFFSMLAFSQGWNIEVEIPVDQARGGGTNASPAQPAAA